MTATPANPLRGGMDRLAGAVTGWVGWVLCGVLIVALSGCGHESNKPEPKDVEPTEGVSTTHYDDKPDTTAPDSPEAGIQAALNALKQGGVEPLPKPTEPMAPGQSCITAGCHVSLVDHKFIHGPVSVANCSSCHQPDTGAHDFPLKREGNQTCLFCHPIVGHREHEHKAVEVSGCQACHDPHSSDTKFLLKAQSTAELCRTCHDMPLKKFAHGPFAAGQCTVCHEPHEADSDMLLRVGKEPDTCFSCHTSIQTRMAESPVVHKPAAESCTNCHDAHTSDYPFQLSAPMADSCFKCHEQMAERVKNSPVSHDALILKDGCANCHDPHASKAQQLLKDRQEVLCLNCHDKPVVADDGRTIPDMSPTLKRKFLHGPVRAGDCAACHTVHGGQNARLLVKQFPDTFYTSFNLTNYALCFSCHSPDLVLTKQTDSLTGFRNGDLNLHYLHVNRDEKGRTCKACHDIHGSDRPDHIASEVPFENSQWSMPIDFKKTATGGSCSPGCHAPMSYDRDEPVKLPPPDSDNAEGGSP